MCNFALILLSSIVIWFSWIFATEIILFKSFVCFIKLLCAAIATMSSI